MSPVIAITTAVDKHTKYTTVHMCTREEDRTVLLEALHCHYQGIAKNQVFGVCHLVHIRDFFRSDKSLTLNVSFLF